MKKLFILAVALVSFLPVMAQQQANAGDKVDGAKDSPAVSDIGMAYNLIRYGYAQQSALPLIQGLQILIATPTQPLDATVEHGTQGNPAAKDNPMQYDVDKLIADAKEYADGDATLLALISQLEGQKTGGTRGAVGGPKSHVDRVLAHSTDTYNIRFRGGEVARVVVIGDGDTDLDLYIYDENGNFITSDTDNTDDCVCSWTPRWTGNFRIKIKNLGNVYNRYVLTTN